MSECPPRSCGPCPHMAHFEKASDPQHYLDKKTVPAPNMQYQQGTSMEPKLGVTSTWNPPDLSATVVKFTEEGQHQQEVYTGGIPPCQDATGPAREDCQPCLKPVHLPISGEPCPQTPYHLEDVKKKYTFKKPGILKKDGLVECECPETIAQVPPVRQPDVDAMINPHERPQCYLPQPEDKIPMSSSEGMGPIGPWATGRVDWGPLSGLTGTRPIVDRYSIHRYSEGDWRHHNKEILDMAHAVQHKTNLIDWNSRQCMAQLQADADKNQEDSTKRIYQKEKEIHRWKCELERAIAAASEEITFMEEQRRRLKSAAAVLQMPEAIAGECLERRTGRLDSELVRDDIEVEIMKERALCDEIRQQFIQTLKDVELQLVEDKTAKQRLEMDWSDKKEAFEIDSKCRALNLRSTILMFKPGAVIFPGDQSTPEYWEHFTKETLQMAETTRQRSATLRGTLDAILLNAAKDLRTQADLVELKLSERIKCYIEMTDNLENNLKKVLQNLADIEKLIDDLEVAIRRMDLVLKKAQTRLAIRLEKQRVENCRDECQFGLIEEVKLIGEQAAALAAQMKQASDSQAGLITARNDLEKEIMLKRKTLEIDRTRIQQFRSYFPSATALAGHS